MASKPESTPFRLKDTAFSCGHSVFAATATEGNLQAENFVTLTFTTQKNSVSIKIVHKASEDLLLCPKVGLLQRVIHLRARGEPHSTPPARVITPVGR